jgi:hypothetical protein
MRLTLIAATYKRPEICNRLLRSLPEEICAVIVCLSGSEGIDQRPNTVLYEAQQMPLTNALNLGVKIADEAFPQTEAYILTDDDVYFCEHTVLDSEIFALLRRRDTGIVAITRIINSINRGRVHIECPFVYKGGGYIIRKAVFHAVGGYTPFNSVDEWDLCIKTYIAGYKNYRTRSAYAYHKQGSAKGGYWQAVKEGSDIGRANDWFKEFLDYGIMQNSGYEYIAHSTVKLKPIAKTLHLANNKKLNA